MFPVMLSSGDDNYIYEINKRYWAYFEDLTYLFNPNPQILEKLLHETSGTLYMKYSHCEGNFPIHGQPMAWLIKHETLKDQLDFRMKWPDQSFAVISFDPERLRYEALTRQVIIEAGSVWKDAEAISIFLNKLKSEGRIESWQLVNSQMQYELILPLAQEFNGTPLIEEILRTSFFKMAFQSRTISACLD